MDASYDYPNGSWYRPQGQSQAVHLVPRAANRAQGISPRSHYRPAKDGMSPRARPPHYSVAKQSRSALPSHYSTTTAPMNATGRAERYTRPTPKSHSHSAHRQARRSSKPQVYVRVNEHDMGRSWYIPKATVRPKNVKRSNGHAKSGNGGNERPGGLVKGWYEAIRRMLSGR